VTRSDSEPQIVVLIATLPNRQELLRRALASVYAQSTPPGRTVLILDGESRDDVPLSCPTGQLIDVHSLVNLGSPGAANTWNTGIQYAAKHWPSCYVAMLDDDDEWDPDHLATCLALARRNHWPDVVLSGLRMIQDGVERFRPPIGQAKKRDFLSGNPGWQGSNTFIRLATLLRAGGFTPGLTSCNDRDLAIRVLCLGDARIVFTHRHTASWHLDESRKALSSNKNPKKLDGLAHFYALHGHRMTPDVRQSFFERAQTIFGWRQEDVVLRAVDYQDAAISSSQD